MGAKKSNPRRCSWVDGNEEGLGPFSWGQRESHRASRQAGGSFPCLLPMFAPSRCPLLNVGPCSSALTCPRIGQGAMHFETPSNGPSSRCRMELGWGDCLFLQVLIKDDNLSSATPAQLTRNGRSGEESVSRIAHETPSPSSAPQCSSMDVL